MKHGHLAWFRLPLHRPPASIDCPECGEPGVQHQYVGDPATRVGYLVIWCPACARGTHVSRARAPVAADLLPFDTPRAVLEARIPPFEMISEAPGRLPD